MIKIIYIYILVLIVIFVYNKINNVELFETNKQYVDFPSIELDDNFGDVVKLKKENTMTKYVEGFEGLFEKKEQFKTELLLEETNTPRYVWTYWENKGDRKEPYAHIKLCFRTMKKHYNKYNFIILDEKTIYKYLPNMRTDLDKLLIAQKVDYYRVMLLKTYGGIWVDADTIALKNLDEIYKKLDKSFDFVGFGCTGKICENGYPYPSNGVMGSRKDGILMSCCIKKLDIILDSNNKKHDYFDLGKKIIWDCLEELKMYDYYHFPSKYDGSRDINGNWVHSPNHLSETPTKLIDEKSAIFIFLANYELTNEESNKWLLELNEEQILNGKWWISSLFRTALK
jgi:hypothetical protein